MTRARVAGMFAVAVGALGWCLALAALMGANPMFVMEVTGTTILAAWALLVTLEVVRSRRLSGALARDAREVAIFGVPLRLTPALGSDAIVVGVLRPVIYLGPDLLATLTQDELRAVVLHEDHHRRTRAPLRAAALSAWLRLLGRSSRVRSVLLDRLADLETLADADAIRRGSDPRAIARALLKGELSLQPVSFAYAAERRVEHLIDRASGGQGDVAGRLPYEWLPVIVLAVVTLGCRAGL